MANLTTLEANALLAASSGQATYTVPVGPVLVALLSAMGDADNPGTEVVGGSYARQTITYAAPSVGSIASNVALTFATMPAVTVVGVEEWDSGGTRRWFGLLSAPKTCNAGDTFSISAGSLTKTLS